MYGIIDLTKLDTSAGASNAFAAPHEGASEREYVEHMRQRFRTDPGARQHILLVGRALVLNRWPVLFTGPYAQKAKAIAIQAWTHAMPASVQGQPASKKEFHVA